MQAGRHPSCDPAALEHVLDLVAYDLHPDVVHLSSADSAVTIAIDVQTEDPRFVYGHVATLLEKCMVGLREHWPHCAGAGVVAVTLVDSSQRFL